MSAPNATGPGLPGSNTNTLILPFPVPVPFNFMLPSQAMTVSQMLGILKDRVEELEQQLADEKRKHSRDVVELNRQLQEARESLEEAHEMVEREARMASLRECILIQKYQAIVDQSTRKVVKLIGSFDALQVTNESLEKKLEQNCSRVTELQRNNAELTEQKAVTEKRCESDTKDLLDVIAGYLKDVNRLEEENAALSFIKNAEEGTNKCKQEQLLHEIDNLKTHVEKLEKKLSCTVCYSEDRDVMYLPCLHMAACKSCADKLSKMSPDKSPLCPVCTGKTRGMAQVYLA